MRRHSMLLLLIFSTGVLAQQPAGEGDQAPAEEQAPWTAEECWELLDEMRLETAAEDDGEGPPESSEPTEDSPGPPPEIPPDCLAFLDASDPLLGLPTEEFEETEPAPEPDPELDPDLDEEQESDPDDEDFTPTEEISEDYPVPLPSDI